MAETKVTRQLRAIEEEGLRKQADEIAKDQALAKILSEWASVAPTVPAGALIALSKAGVSHDTPLGQWVVRSAVPILSGKDRTGKQMSEQEIDATWALISNPNRLYGIKTSTAPDVLAHSPANVGQLSDEAFIDYTESGDVKQDQGWKGYVGDVTRPTFGVLQAGYELGQAGYRSVAAGAPRGVINEGFSTEALAPSYGTKDKLTGARYGKASDVLDFSAQTMIGQALQGKNMGSGFFPGGEALQAQSEAARRSASIDGHALTPGRSFASVVTEPGTVPYQIMSGSVDAAVAIYADPSTVALDTLSATTKASRLFAPTSEAAVIATADRLIDNLGPKNARALQTWAHGGAARSGNLRNDIITKLTDDPGSLQQLVDQGVTTHKEVLTAIAGRSAGLVNGTRKAISPNDALYFLNSKPGRDLAERLADDGFSEIWRRTNGKMSARVTADLAEADNVDDVRRILANNLGTDIRNAPFAYSRPFSELRWATKMPKGVVDAENVDEAVEQARRTLIATNVPKDRWDDVLIGVARAENQPQMFDAYVHGVGNAVRNSLVDGGVNPRLARDLTRFFPDDWDEQRKFFIDEVGDTPHFPGLIVNGDPVPIVGPHLVSEMLNRAIPPLDIRAIKRANARWGSVYEAPFIGKGIKGTDYLMDSVNNWFKIGALFRLALPIRNLMDEQTRMAVAGLDSMWHHPLSFLAWTVGKARKGGEDVLGRSFIEEMGDNASSISRGIGQNTLSNKSIFDADQMFAKHAVTYRFQDNPNAFLRAWGDELSALHIDPVARETARGMRDLAYAPSGVTNAGGVDAIKEWFWSGAGRTYREDLGASGLWRGESQYLLRDRTMADAYVDSVVERITVKTGGSADLLDDVALGTPFSAKGIAKDYGDKLDSLKSQGFGPDAAKGFAAAGKPGRGAVFDKAVDKMFSVLMDRPSRQFTGSLVFVQSYWKRVDELFPYLTKDLQDQLRVQASRLKIKLTNDGKGAAGRITEMEQIDKLSQSFALKTVRDLLYTPGARANATDVLRQIAPFGEAWRDVIKTWSRMAVTDPKIIRRFQQGVTAARNTGWWYTDPEDGIEKFTIIPAGMMKHLAGVPFPMTARVQGLNIVGTGLPGVGPVVQWPASIVMSQFDVPAETGFREFISPFGEPDFAGGPVEELLFPGWLDKLRTSGWGVFELLQTGEQKRMLDGVIADVVSYKMSTGNYDISDPAQHEKLLKDATRDARKLYMWRGLAQFASPSAPSFKDTVQLKDGSLIESFLVAQDYRNMLELTGDSYEATRQFIDKYGTDLIFATQGKSRSLNFSLPTTAQAEMWRENHGEFARRFPDLYGYFAPQNGDFDHEAYLRQIRDGEREALSPEKWMALAEARLGNAVYDNLRKKLPASPSKEQRDWLKRREAQIAKEFPGFGDRQRLTVSKNDLDTNVAKLREAVKHPDVAGQPLSHAIIAYLDKRDQAVAAADGNNLAGEGDVAFREWLFRRGNQIAKEIPEFTTIWNELLSREVQDDGV